MWIKLRFKQNLAGAAYMQVRSIDQNLLVIVVGFVCLFVSVLSFISLFFIFVVWDFKVFTVTGIVHTISSLACELHESLTSYFGRLYFAGEHLSPSSLFSQGRGAGETAHYGLHWQAQLFCQWECRGHASEAGVSGRRSVSCTSSSSSAFTAISLGFTILGEIFWVWSQNPC